MSLNLNIGEPDPPKKKKKPDLPIVQIKNTADYQRMKLDRLMANPDKPVIIPGPGKNKNLAPPPDFVRNIMGSSAGAGSGEFHVYRHLRRKEYARQKQITEQARIEQKEADFQARIETNKRLAEEKTARKRAKRLKKKAGAKKKKGGTNVVKPVSSSSSESDDEVDNTCPVAETNNVDTTKQAESSEKTAEIVDDSEQTS